MVGYTIIASALSLSLPLTPPPPFLSEAYPHLVTLTYTLVHLVLSSLPFTSPLSLRSFSLSPSYPPPPFLSEAYPHLVTLTYTLVHLVLSSLPFTSPLSLRSFSLSPSSPPPLSLYEAYPHLIIPTYNQVHLHSLLSSFPPLSKLAWSATL